MKNQYTSKSKTPFQSPVEDIAGEAEVKYIVAFMLQKPGGYGVDETTSDFEVFIEGDAKKDAQDRYKQLLKQGNLYSASICQIIESTDY